MTGHLTADARAIAEQAYQHAIRLGDPHLGGEHFRPRSWIATTGPANPPAITRGGVRALA
jgi:hypothetical protein